MKMLIFSVGLIFAMIMLITCEENETEIIPPDEISFVRSELGGCNAQQFNEIKRTVTEQQEDTVIFTIENDTLYTFIGLNYICCAPFTSDVKVSNNSIAYSLSDICSETTQPCYCKCMCYYTWNFLFVDFEEKEYHYKIILNDPREDQPIILEEGWVDLSQM